MSSVLTRLKAATTAAGLLWNVAITSDAAAINYVVNVMRFEDRKRVEEQLRRQGHAEIADRIR